MICKGVPNPSKGIFALLLFLGTTVTAVFGQKNTKPTFVLKDRFICSGGLFFAQPANSANENNYAGLSFSPQLNLLNSFSDFSIAVGTQFDAGYRLSPSGSSSKMMASIPALITINAGHLASRDFFSRFGLFAGGGYDFCFIEGDMREGILWSAGLRTWLFKKSFTFRYSQAMLDESFTMRFVSLQLNLGAYLKSVYRNNQISNFVKPMHR